MDIKRTMPRVGCSIPCKIIFNETSELHGYVADVSCDGLSFSPSDGEFPDSFSDSKSFSVEIDMSDFSDIGKTINFEANLKWKRGMIVGFKVEFMDMTNFKKWWFLVFTLFFPKKPKT
ncbi:PilZ domain-containing protein [Vibrio parahaemolyticus]|uniref:PilZ domain-containing protein n=1 Tax=Vibrio parahaemolyticus TaxID=670 RepID=A0AAW8PYL0_VIBPH|nr:PilZ domain-containing protein [Vibrio parahaemolyticus]EGR2229528.1 PilZ domain-containing protein [Vibrio parahaemolyticus]MDS1820925.1 PilZ domain-containing protein [Vibrio parahaemolyticus]